MRALLLTLVMLAACKGDDVKDDTGTPQTDDSATDDSSTDDSSADDTGTDDSAPDDSGPDDSSPPTDADGDGYTSPEDCDDNNGDVHPGATEVCDGLDNDCNDEVDDNAVDATLSWGDRDRDGYGDPEAIYEGCTTIEDSVDNADDCNDGDPAINPSAQEVCDEDRVDEDCDGDSDDNDDSVDPAGFTTYYDDSDGDTYGDASTATDTCHAHGRVTNGEDCDDTDANLTTSCDVSRDGTYSGTFSAAVTVTTFGVSDTCSGTGSIDVDTTQSTPITGSFTCSWAGLGASLIGNQTITLDGTIPSDPSASGNISVGSVISDTWSGSFTNATTLTGSFSGSGTYSSYSITWSGSFTAAL